MKKANIFGLSSLVSALISLFSFAALAQQSTLEIAAAVNEYRSEREQQIIEDFVDLLSLPNDSANLDDIDDNVDLIISMLQSRGIETQVLRAGRSPYVYGEINTPGATETLLLYAHFDGQPVQEENWTYPPFTPTLVDAPLPGGDPINLDSVNGEFDPEWRLYARSAGDDKMPVIAIIHTLDALRENGIELSVNLKLLFDGEEERGSPTLGQVIDANPGLFDADLLLFCDGPMHQSRRAQLVFGVRGSATVDITTYGATRPLHSGHYGNWAPNPIMQLSYLLTSMRDKTGRILVNGYYDNVATLSEFERAAINAMPDTSTGLQSELSIHTPEGGGVRLEELVTLPAINARGIVAGGVGLQGRNIILPSATVSLNLRMVPNQNPTRLRQLIEDHVEREGFYIVHGDPTEGQLRNNEKVAKLDWRGAGNAGLRTPMDSPIAQKLIRIMQELTSDLILTPSMGGTLPLNAFDDRVDTPIIVLPLANHDNNQHGRDENIRIQNIWDAMAVYGVVLAQFGGR